MIIFDSTQSPEAHSVFTGVDAGGFFRSAVESDVDGFIPVDQGESDDGNAFIRPETERVRAPGNVALRSWINRSLPSPRWMRAEVTGAKADVTRELPHDSNEEYWFAFSVWSDATNLFDTNPEVLFQTHSPVGAPTNSSPGLGIWLERGRFHFRNRYSADGEVAVEGPQIVLSDIIQNERWYDFIIRAKLDTATPGVGYVWVWINDHMRLKAVETPTQALNADMTFRIQYGCYKWAWGSEAVPDNGVNTRSYVHDEIRIGDANETYASMRCKTPNPALNLGPQPPAVDMT